MVWARYRLLPFALWVEQISDAKGSLRWKVTESHQKRCKQTKTKRPFESVGRTSLLNTMGPIPVRGSHCLADMWPKLLARPLDFWSSVYRTANHVNCKHMEPPTRIGLPNVMARGDGWLLRRSNSGSGAAWNQFV